MIEYSFYKSAAAIPDFLSKFPWSLILIQRSMQPEIESATSAIYPACDINIGVLLRAGISGSFALAVITAQTIKLASY